MVGVMASGDVAAATSTSPSPTSAYNACQWAAMAMCPRAHLLATDFNRPSLAPTRQATHTLHTRMGRDVAIQYLIPKAPLADSWGIPESRRG
jgi:hypothetical protein